jgi:hypothetical protein
MLEPLFTPFQESVYIKVFTNNLTNNHYEKTLTANRFAIVGSVR